IRVDITASVFLDYGCGKGRAVVAAATFPFRKVIGIELSRRLADIATHNIHHMRHKKAKQVEIIQVDATTYTLPLDVNVVYFFNPFVGNDLRQVVDVIRLSFFRRPRRIVIVYFNSIHFERIILSENWVRKVHQAHVYPNYSCSVYETTYEI